MSGYDPTPEHRAILAHSTERHGRVLAGLGPSKSATVVALVTGLLAEESVGRIALITFTRAATAEHAAKVAAHEAQVERRAPSIPSPSPRYRYRVFGLRAVSTAGG